jgi:hypothetical protein
MPIDEEEQNLGDGNNDPACKENGLDGVRARLGDHQKILVRPCRIIAPETTLQVMYSVLLSAQY